MGLKRNWKGKGKIDNNANRLTYALVAIYLTALFWILLFKLGVRFTYMADRSVNLIPFREFLISTGNADVGEVILNVLIFVPLGIYAGVLCKRWTFVSKLFLFFLISLLFEGLQFILRIGAFDITDIITNISGGIIGLLIFESIEKLLNNSIRAQKIINILATIGTILMIIILILLKLNKLPVRYQ